MKTLLGIFLALMLTTNLYGSTIMLRTFQDSDQNNRLLDIVSVDDATTGATEETIYSFSVPADIMGTNHRLRLVLQGDTVGGTDAMTMRLKYGATTLVTMVSSPPNDPSSFIMTAELSADGSTALQFGTLVIAMQDSNNDAEVGTSAEDSTGALTMEVTVETTSAVLIYTMRHAVMQLLSD